MTFLAASFVYGQANPGYQGVGTLEYATEAIERGRLIGKQSVHPHFIALMRQERWGVYGEFDAWLPLKDKDYFPERYKGAVGFLGKATDYLTMDIGLSRTGLHRNGFELLPNWTEAYIGVRSDLLMQPSFYFFWDFDRHQWGTEVKFHYDFDGSVFDWPQWILTWENQWSLWKGRRPYGTKHGERNCKYKYMVFETGLFLKRLFEQRGTVYVGMSCTYNTGGAQPWTCVNNATHRSHFFSLRFGCSITL